ncbi:MAG: cysteine--tRNA ligase [Candidatus Yanofskybacteria bacterium RIFCSPHIGHO2_02_FULL_41_11]|uniref:Cysteine--tRNA ligase n=1 Tax=Candidatus Yanofskybacteria bacterium RIFCSPHIGHO2_02_FULL_41_11 TaxID=1802675 RepID=A0A1F8F810_9BACT|nr:MAG: cysteine--tRNA ligase [Candidatus Yanofskybacteria bacterium RIFCSPHIGHO2_02_FULL_41_11]
MIKLTNTLTGQKEEFVPAQDKKVQMFVCGPTVYNYIHIGNARTFVFFDVVAKYLRHKGYDVNYIQNITDIDNKIIERAQKEGADPLEYAKKYTEIFKQDMKALGVTSPEYKNATDHIPEVIKQVQTLLDKGNAYVIENDGIYFDLSTFPDYGKLSGRTAGMADDAVSRIDDSDKKRNRGDFAIWKFSQAGDPSWSAPFGEGRPGWHIEDTAITEKYFGPQYDIHGGGEDLKFPHHEAEIAQQESASGKKPFVKYWMHVAFVVNKEQKMSKSLGNFAMAHQLLEKYPKEVLRFYLLSGYYRTSLDFSEKILIQSAAAVQRISEFKRALEITDQKGQGNVFTHNDRVVDPEESERMFFESLDNDLNTQEAFGHLFGLIRVINLPLRIGAISKEYARPVLGFLDKVNEILGIVPTSHIEIPKEVMKLVTKRGGLREQQNWQEADKIRAQIEKMGYRIDDTIYGPLITKE